MKEEDIIDEGNDELLEEINIEIDKGQTPVRIDKFLMDRLQKTSRNKLQNAINVGAITVDGLPIKVSFKVKPLQKIKIIFHASPYDHSKILPQNIPLDILYEDQDIIVINKPPGLVVHPGFGNFEGTLLNALYYHCNTPNQDNKIQPALVHRIDKDTSGILIASKNEHSAAHLAKQFFNHTIEREYYALVWGDLVENEGTIEGNIARDPRDRMQFKVFTDGKTGKPAITHYSVIERFHYVTLIKCNLETGRTHQIRVHMKFIGHTLFGDVRYGGDKALKGTIFTKYKQFVSNCLELIPRQALHARLLGFEHPTTGKMMRFEVNIPSDLENAITKWRNYVQSRINLLESESKSF